MVYRILLHLTGKLVFHMSYYSLHNSYVVALTQSRSLSLDFHCSWRTKFNLADVARAGITYLPIIPQMCSGLLFSIQLILTSSRYSVTNLAMCGLALSYISTNVVQWMAQKVPPDLEEFNQHKVRTSVCRNASPNHYWTTSEW